MNERIVEEICRALCLDENIDPDQIGIACREDTKKRLGNTYPLWKYRIKTVEKIISIMQKSS